MFYKVYSVTVFYHCIITLQTNHSICNNFSFCHRNELLKPIKISFPINKGTSDRKKSRATRVFCQAAGYQFSCSHWRRVVREERSSGKYERSRDSVPFALMMRTIRSKKRACGFLVYFPASSAMANWNRETLPCSMTFPETLQMKYRNLLKDDFENLQTVSVWRYVNKCKSFNNMCWHMHRIPSSYV